MFRIQILSDVAARAKSVFGKEVSLRGIGTALAVGDLLLCLVLTGSYVCGRSSSRRQEAVVNVAQEGAPEQEREVRRIAITFDDEVIIGLSQEICCKEAISMI